MKHEEWKQFKSEFKNLTPSWKTFAVVAFDLGLLILSVLLFSSNKFFLVLLSIVLLTLVLLHAYLLKHEATHFAFAKNRRLNECAGHILGWFILMPYLPRQRSHLLHHTWTGHPTGDPANRRFIKGFSVMTQKQANRLEFMWKHWIPLIVINDRIGLWRDPFQLYKAGDRSFRIRREIKATYGYLVGYILLISALIASGYLFKFLMWYLPAFILVCVLEEMANLPHHAEPKLMDEKEPALPYWEQHKVTHSCKPTPIWSRFIMLNFNLHITHHLFPWIPWHDLRYVHERIDSKLPEPEIKADTLDEVRWSMKHRQKPLLHLMGDYFDKLPKPQPE